MDRRLRFVVPAVSLVVFVLGMLLIDDPKKPWSGIAYVSALLTIVGTGWAIGHWLLVIVPWSVFAVALVLWSDDTPTSGDCDPACWSGGAGEFAGLLGFVLGSLLAIGVALRWVMDRIGKTRARKSTN